MARKMLQMAAGTALVFGSFWNFHLVDRNIEYFKPRAEEEISVLENQYLPVNAAMLGQHPAPKRIGYFTSLTLKGLPPDADSDRRWSELRYLAIPRILLRSMREPYVLGDFRNGEPIPQVPENLVMVYDSGNGLILYKQKRIP